MLPSLDFNQSNLILSIKITKQLYFVQWLQFCLYRVRSLGFVNSLQILNL